MDNTIIEIILIIFGFAWQDGARWYRKPSGN